MCLSRSCNAFTSLSSLRLTRAPALYFVLTIYKWYKHLELDEQSLAQHILRRNQRPRQIRSLVTLFVRDEAAVFLVITSAPSALSRGLQPNVSMQ
jgi:hypothetical protein